MRKKPKIPVEPRPSQASDNLVDLTSFYNIALRETIHDKPGNDLSEFPSGIQNFGGTEFDVRGIIQLSSSISEEKTKVVYPYRVKGIPVNKNVEGLSFIQSSAWDSEKGSLVAYYRVNYSDDTTIDIPIKFQVNVEDWWVMPNSIMPTEAEIAWKGENSRTINLNYSLQLYKYVWQNPNPLKEIVSIDFVSTNERTGAMLFAITVTPL